MLILKTLTTSMIRMAMAIVVAAGLFFAAGAGKTAMSAELSAAKTLQIEEQRLFGLGNNVVGTARLLLACLDSLTGLRRLNS